LKTITKEEKKRRVMVLRDFLAQGWRGAELYKHAKEFLDIGPKKVREIVDQINAQEAKESAFLVDVEVNATKELDQINEAIRLVLRESRDQKDSNGVVVKRGTPLDKNAYIKLLTLRSKITGSMQVAKTIVDKRSRSNSYLGIELGDDVAGGTELVADEEELRLLAEEQTRLLQSKEEEVDGGEIAVYKIEEGDK
jgi:hypothetical protein